MVFDEILEEICILEKKLHLKFTVHILKVPALRKKQS